MHKYIEKGTNSYIDVKEENVQWHVSTQMPHITSHIFKIYAFMRNCMHTHAHVTIMSNVYSYKWFLDTFRCDILCTYM